MLTNKSKTRNTCYLKGIYLYETMEIQPNYYINPLPPTYIVYFRTNNIVGKMAIWLR